MKQRKIPSTPEEIKRHYALCWKYHYLLRLLHDYAPRHDRRDLGGKLNELAMTKQLMIGEWWRWKY